MGRKIIFGHMLLVFMVFLACTREQQTTEQINLEAKQEQLLFKQNWQGKSDYEQAEQIYEIAPIPQIHLWTQYQQQYWEQANPQYHSANDFKWQKYGSGIKITFYTGSNTDIQFPPQMFGLPVIRIGGWSRVATNLTSLTIPDSVIYIGSDAFWDNQLTSVIIGSGVTSIGNMAFAANQLTEIVIPGNVIDIWHGAFNDNQLTSLIIPDSVTAIGAAAFALNQLTCVIIGNGVTVISNHAFVENQLGKINIPDNVTVIDNDAFDRNPLTSISIGADVLLIRFVDTSTVWNSFVNTYDGNSRRAGTYTLENGRWFFAQSVDIRF